MKQDTDRIAFFDFDGTLTRKDTLLEIIKYICGKRAFYFGFIQLLPTLLAYKLHIIPNWEAKEKVLTYFFGGLAEDSFQEQCNRFAQEELPKLMRMNTFRQLEQLQHEGVRIIIVTASAENWISAWCQKQGVEYIGTRLQVKNDKITGKLSGPNCYGQEKVNRINEVVNLNNYSEIYAYGDSKGDIPMLQIATYPYYQKFDELKTTSSV